MTIDVEYDRAELAVNDTVNVNVNVSLNQKRRAGRSLALIDLGLPPGFTVLSEDLDALVDSYDAKPKTYAGPAVQRYELTGRQILVYLTNLAEGTPHHLQLPPARPLPAGVHTPASSAYDYYNPALTGQSVPQAIVVK